jgi:DNA-binding transcriptional LysR family regulator
MATGEEALELIGFFLKVERWPDDGSFSQKDHYVEIGNIVRISSTIPPMDRFQEMQVFVRIAERGSFTQAADDLQLPRATVSNLIQRLEARLGVRLLERTTRTVRLTPDGEAYRQRCVGLLADLEEADGLFRQAVPKGLLRVNLQGTLARRFVVPALPTFLARHPQLELQIGEDDRLVDLVREGVDCVLRAGQLRDSSLVARRVALLPQLTCASASYLAQFGEPRTLADLAGHRAVNYLSSATGQALPLEFTVNGEVRTLSLSGPVSVTGADVYAGAAIAGLGLVQVPRYRVADELASGQLREVLADLSPPPLPVSVLYPQNRQLSVRVRAFAQWLGELFERSSDHPLR